VLLHENVNVGKVIINLWGWHSDIRYLPDRLRSDESKRKLFAEIVGMKCRVSGRVIFCRNSKPSWNYLPKSIGE